MPTGCRYARDGEWLMLSARDLILSARDGERAEAAFPKAGSHPHAVRQWLLAFSRFPDKWINRLFSVGGIRFDGDGGTVGLRAFAPAPEDDPMYALALRTVREAEAARSAPLPGGKGTVGERFMNGAAALFEDDWCLVLNKPSGMPVHPSAPGQRGTLDEAAALHCLIAGDPLPVKHIHRLDEDTAGPVLYAKNELAQLRLDEAMRAKAIERQYEALVHGRLERATGTVRAAIGKDRHHPARRRVSPSGDPAVTHYETLQVYDRCSLLRLRLETGRTHQIRVHMSHIGHPLLGDSLYGGTDDRLRHQALRGELLVFPHPYTGERIAVRSPEPDWFREARIRAEAGGAR